MWIHLDNFKYDELLETIVTQKQLKDTVLTTEILAEIFKKLGRVGKFKKIDAPCKYKTLINNLIDALSLIKDGIDSPDCTEILAEFSKKLGQTFTKEDPMYPVLKLVKDFYGTYLDEDEIDTITIMISPSEIESLLTDIDLEIMDIIDNVEQLEKKDEADILIERQIKEMLYIEENDPNLVWELVVLDLKGPTVKYGDNLIRFPTLVAIVRPTI
ncbi:putative virion structural protein [Aeromonas phage ZPAH34]|uniref:putative virion structural protein n=1 Tax=Aeromonas phage ZPAH34 TaxID=2924888 RepID=UPI0023290C3D|nr:putative virion structural protein [Aeromonas phage ZPAH34]UOX39656.1 putative virion structural protein [Aeromonas phage ZPAH34]